MELILSETPQRKLAAIMFSDMQGFSMQMDADEMGTMKILRKHNRVMDTAIANHNGRVVKTIGDAYMVEFASTVNAVACALDAQRHFSELNVEAQQNNLYAVRIGIHVGDVMQEGTDLFGEAVNVAARLEPKADVGGICISQAVYSQVRRKVHAVGRDLGMVELKNISEPMRLFAIRPSSEHLSINDQSSDPESRNNDEQKKISFILRAMMALCVALGIFAVGLWQAGLFEESEAENTVENQQEYSPTTESVSD